MESLMAWCSSSKSSDPMYLRIEARFATRSIVSKALQGSARLDFAGGVTHRMSPSPETVHWRHCYFDIALPQQRFWANSRISPKFAVLGLYSLTS